MQEEELLCKLAAVGLTVELPQQVPDYFQLVDDLAPARALLRGMFEEFLQTVAQHPFVGLERTNSLLELANVCAWPFAEKLLPLKGIFQDGYNIFKLRSDHLIDMLLASIFVNRCAYLQQEPRNSYQGRVPFLVSGNLLEGLQNGVHNYQRLL